MVTNGVAIKLSDRQITDGAQYGKVRAEGLIWSSTIQTQQ